ncbi:MAG: hypothetical protein K0V04_04370, partial [Deltaproteobacteria bacterium]|nr:hypothetical protein [Deltaproteobacteria bacterium]
TGRGSTGPGPVGETTSVEPPPAGTTAAIDPTTGGTNPLIEISDGPSFDFGPIDTSSASTHLFQITNAGDDVATGLGGSDPGGAFTYTGGGYPGDNGTCGAQLDDGDSCTVEIRFGPDALGLLFGTLTIDYDQGQAIRSMQGGGAGTSGNLLDNPGGENTGTPPPGWTNTNPQVWTWIAGVFGDGENFPFAGSNYITSDAGPNNQPYQLTQVVDVGTWVATIDADAIRFEFVGSARSLVSGNDDYRMIVRYLDGAGNNLEAATTNWQSSETWTTYGDNRTAPVGTRSIEVELGCQKSSGGICHAYFDALQVRAVYP